MLNLRVSGPDEVGPVAAHGPDHLLIRSLPFQWDDSISVERQGDVEGERYIHHMDGAGQLLPVGLVHVGEAVVEHKTDL